MTQIKPGCYLTPYQSSLFEKLVDNVFVVNFKFESGQFVQLRHVEGPMLLLKIDDEQVAIVSVDQAAFFDLLVPGRTNGWVDFSSAFTAFVKAKTDQWVVLPHYRPE